MIRQLPPDYDPQAFPNEMISFDDGPTNEMFRLMAEEILREVEQERQQQRTLAQTQAHNPLLS